MSRYSCNDSEDHRRQAKDDFRRWGRPDYDMLDKQHDDECAAEYMGAYRGAERAEEDRQREREEEERHQVAMERQRRDAQDDEERDRYEQERIEEAHYEEQPAPEIP